MEITEVLAAGDGGGAHKIHSLFIIQRDFLWRLHRVHVRGWAEGERAWEHEGDPKRKNKEREKIFPRALKILPCSAGITWSEGAPGGGRRRRGMDGAFGGAVGASVGAVKGGWLESRERDKVCFKKNK